MKSSSLLRCLCMAFMLPLVLICQSNAQSMLIGFTDTLYVPTATPSGDSILLNFPDVNLTGKAAQYKIIEFKQEYPAAILFSHANAGILSRVYRIRVASNTTSFISDMTGVASPHVYNIETLEDPAVMSEPDDYNGHDSYFDTYSSEFLNLINAKKAWDYTRGLDCIMVGVSDIGFAHHTDMDAKVDNLTTLPPNVPLYAASGPWHPYYGIHGLESAGAIAAITNNGSGLASLGNKVKVRYYDWNLNGVLQAAQDGCKVVNCSWGHTGSALAFEQMAIDMVNAMDVTIVAGAGNGFFGNSTEYWYPASYDHVISVSSVGSQFPVGTYLPDPSIVGGFAWNWVDCHRRYSNVNDPHYSETYQHNDKVDILAPGHWITTLYVYDGLSSNGGTSLSAPLVSAAAALLYSLDPSITPNDVEYYLKLGAADVSGISDNNTWTGLLGGISGDGGRLDAGRSIELAVGDGVGCEPTFSGITWEYWDASSLAYIPLSNNYDIWAHFAQTIQFATTTSAASGTTVEWEFIFNGNSIIKTGSSVTLDFSTDFSGIPLIHNVHAPDYCLNKLEVFVRQYSSSCCSSPTYKDVAVGPYWCDYIKPTTQNNKLPELTLADKIKIYPSPASAVINVALAAQQTSKKGLEYQIINIDGKVMKTGVLTSGSTTIYIASYAKGIYLFKTAMGNIKFVKN